VPALPRHLCARHLLPQLCVLDGCKGPSAKAGLGGEYNQQAAGLLRLYPWHQTKDNKTLCTAGGNAGGNGGVGGPELLGRLYVCCGSTRNTLPNTKLQCTAVRCGSSGQQQWCGKGDPSCWEGCKRQLTSRPSLRHLVSQVLVLIQSGVVYLLQLGGKLSNHTLPI
jgi:hypothetical protein